MSMCQKYMSIFRKMARTMTTGAASIIPIIIGYPRSPQGESQWVLSEVIVLKERVRS